MKLPRVNAKSLKKWIRISQIVWLVLVGAAIVLMIMQYNFSQASTGPGEVVDLQAWVQGWSGQLGILVGLIAVVMVIIAGIVYAFDLGGGKQIGLAKEMIISAISGVILFMLASWLLNEIGGENGLFPRQNTDTGTADTADSPRTASTPTADHLPPTEPPIPPPADDVVPVTP